MSRFSLPRDIYYGAGAIEELKALKGRKRAFIVTGGHSMREGGFLKRLEDVLSRAGMSTRLFEGVEPDPSVETVRRGAEAMREFQPDVIAAMGGGSPIDAAKAMWVLYEHPELSFEDMKKPFTLPKLRSKAIFAAIPSTSGTATEVTAFSVITDYGNKVKYPIADFEITPDIAILDSDLAQTMPPELAGHTGMDALTHAIEAYTASLRSPFSDPLALKATSMIFDDLVASYEGDAEARGRMHIAQCLAGMAFSNALLGICHSLAHKIGAQFEISHGCCNAVLLPYVIAFNARTSARLYADIARCLNLQGATDAQLTHSLMMEVRRLAERVGISPTLRANGVTEAQFAAKLDFIAEQAKLDPCTGSNPRPATTGELKRLLECAFSGKDITF